MAARPFPVARIVPRLYELKTLVDPTHPRAYFQNLEQIVREHRSVRRQFRKKERQLAALDPTAWVNLRDRAKPLLTVHEPGRGWRALWDLLDEANAYGYLKRIGCSDIQFVKTGPGKTPDLSAWRQGRLVLCEVKAINITQREAERRERISAGESMVCSTPMTVPDPVLRKIRSSILSAIEQLDAVDPARQSQRFVFTVLHFDDWVGDFQDRYIKQLDRYLLANPVEGAQLVFYIARDLFGRRFRMKSATVCKS